MSDDDINMKIGCGCMLAALIGAAFLLTCLALGVSDVTLAILHLAHGR